MVLFLFGCFCTLLLFKVVDFRSRLLAFRGAGGEPHLYVSLLSVSPARLSRRTRKAPAASHRTKKMCFFIFEESRTLHSNQLVKEFESNNLLDRAFLC